MSSLNQVRLYLTDLQQRITSAIEVVDGSAFLVDAWSKAADEPLQGQGVTCILENS